MKLSEIKIFEQGRLVRILGSEIEQGDVLLLGANEFKYQLDAADWSVKSRSYYR